MTLEEQKIVEDAAKDGHYQIVCRRTFAALNSWYITITDTEDWDWNISEYRIFIGTREPPMINEMNAYSVYYCGYTYYFIDNDSKVKKVTNVNFTELGEQYTSFLKCAKIQADNIYANETGLVRIKDNTVLEKNADVTGSLSVSGETTLGVTYVRNDLTVHDDVKFEKGFEVVGETKFDGDVQIDGDFTLKGQFKVAGASQAQESNADSVNTEILRTYNIARNKNKGNGSITVNSNLDVIGDSEAIEFYPGNIRAAAELSSNTLKVSGSASTGNLTVNGTNTINDDTTINGNLTVSGSINNLLISIT